MRKLYILFSMVSFMVFAVIVSMPSTAHATNPTVDNHIIVSERVVEELWNNGDLASVSEFYNLPFTDHAFTINEPVSWVPIAWGNTAIRMYHQAFPDLEMTIVNTIATDDMVIVQYSAHGTHRGEFANVNGKSIPATNRHLAWDGVWMFRFIDGKIEEQWAYSNNPIVQQSGYGNITD